MTTLPRHPGFDGLMTLSRREGVDIRPTLLRVLTDLYVQAPSHSVEEERQFVALASRLIDEVDDATRAAVRARLSIYVRTPPAIAEKLKLRAPPPRRSAPAPDFDAISQPPPAPSPAPAPAATLSMQPDDASELNRMFFAAVGGERLEILRKLEQSPLRPAPRIEAQRAARALAALEKMALEADMLGFIRELAHVLILPEKMAERIVQDPAGEPLALACRAIGMGSEGFERVLLFLDPELGASVQRVYRLSRLYDTLSERLALVMLAAWRGTNAAALRPARHQALLHDDERARARMAPGLDRAPVAQPGTGRIRAKS
jgi:hypothetical protein